ncbi:hypothetical protein BS101_16930 [Clostridium kluyveri]|uniref:Glycosyltransferase family 1 protein n=2 Tax=Clostridium kluyveri TaxID=1534 RepID=A0A1L5FE62_CLOKL|nr:hypothetical protein BS101_16930 [Clostridium kluyveri]
MDRGGIETFIMNVYRNIDRSKVQFDFLMHTKRECAYNSEIFKLGGRIYYVPPRNQGILKNRKELNEFFEKHSEYKIVHQHVSSLSYITPLKIAKKYNIPIRIIHSHNTKQGGNFLHKYIHYWNRLFIKYYATNYFACSDLAAKWLYGRKQYNLGNFTTINNGIEVEKFTYNNNIRDKVRAELGVSNKIVIGNIGRFSYQKNHEFLIDIFNNIYQKSDNFTLLLVGDGELRSHIQNKVKDLKLQDNVIFTGIRSDIPYILQAMDIFVMPSHYEGLPVTLVEAQAAGLPCVVSSNITRQIKITSDIIYINLSDSVEYWSKCVMKLVSNHVRKNTKQQIIDAGFSIKIIAKYLENKYIAFNNKNI